MDTRASRSGETAALKTTRAGRRHLLFLEPHEQWSVLALCLTAGDLAQALGPPVQPGTEDALDLQLLALRRLKVDAALCRALQERLDQSARHWLILAAGCGDGPQLEALWDAALTQDRAAPAYWVLVSQAATPDALRRRAFRDIGAARVAPCGCDGHGASQPRASGEITRLAADMLVALKTEQERNSGLLAALQIETALRRQSQRRVDELEQQLAAMG